MDRRDFLKTTGAAAAVAATAVAAAEAAHASNEEAGLAAPAIGKDVTELRMVMPWPDRVSGFADNAHRLARRIETATDGRFRIEVGPAARGLAEAVRGGDADFYHGTEHDNLARHRAFSYFGGLPGEMGLRSSDLEAWLMVGGGQILWDDLAGDFGVKPLLVGHTGRMELMSSTKIETLADVEGRKIFAMGLAREVVRGLGAEPAEVPASRLADALVSGEALAVEWGGALANSALGLDADLSRTPMPAFNRAGTVLSLGLARRVWDKLSTSDKTIFEAVAAEQFRVSLAEERAHHRIMALARRGSEAAHPYARWRNFNADSEFLLARRRVTAAVVAEVAGSDAKAARINASYMAFQRQGGRRSSTFTS